MSLSSKFEFRNLNPQGDVRLVDFNPFCPRTDSLLFSWDELASGCVTGEGDAPGNNPVIRVVQDEASIQPHDLQECPYPQVGGAAGL